jgi:hypothetical protein
MAEHALEAATVEEKGRILVYGKFAFKLFELTVRYANGGRDVALEKFWLMGSCVHKDCLVTGYLICHVLYRHLGIGPWSFHPAGKTVGKDLDILIS